MKQFKQTAFILVVAMLFMFAMSVMADTVPTVTLSSVQTDAAAGSSVDIAVDITASSEIATAKIYINDVFHEMIHNPDKNFNYTFIVPATATGTVDLKMVATDALGGVGYGNVLSFEIFPNTSSSIEFKDIPEVSKYTDFNEITAEIFDADGIQDVSLYINGNLAEASVTNTDNSYTFSEFPKYLGDMNIEIRVTDTYGVITSAKTTTKLEAFYLTKIFSSVMDYVPSGSFKYNAANGYSFGVDKYTGSDGVENKFMKVSRPSAGDSKTTYFRYQIRDAMGNLEGVFELEFDLKFTQGFENVYLNFNPRGAKEPLTPMITGSKVELKNGSETVTVENVFEKDKWYHLRYVCDTINKTYRFFVDNTELTAGDEPYALPLSASDTMGAMIYLAVNIRMPDSDDSLGIDNIKYSYENVLANIQTAQYADGVVSAVIKDGIKTADVQSATVLNKNGKSVELESVNYNESTKTLTVVPKNELASASEYQLILNAGIANAEGKIIETDAYKNFITNPESFDVTSVDFINTLEGTGVNAILENNTDSVKTVLMIMTVKNENGAVESVHASQNVTLNPGDENILLEINPVYTEGKTVEVFFLDNWVSNNAIKKYVYINN